MIMEPLLFHKSVCACMILLVVNNWNLFCKTDLYRFTLVLQTIFFPILAPQAENNRINITINENDTALIFVCLKVIFCLCV